jgi:hypothetical protein
MPWTPRLHQRCGRIAAMVYLEHLKELGMMRKELEDSEEE